MSADLTVAVFVLAHDHTHPDQCRLLCLGGGVRHGALDAALMRYHHRRNFPVTDRPDQGPRWISAAARDALRRVHGKAGNDNNDPADEPDTSSSDEQATPANTMLPPPPPPPPGEEIEPEWVDGIRSSISEVLAGVGEMATIVPDLVTDASKISREQTVAVIREEFETAAKDVHASLSDAAETVTSAVLVVQEAAQNQPEWVDGLVSDVSEIASQIETGVGTLTEITSVSLDSIRESLSKENDWAANLSDHVDSIQAGLSDEPAWAVTMRTGLAAVYSNMEATPDWVHQVQERLGDVHTQLETASARSDTAAERVADLLEVHRTSAPEWADHLAAQTSAAKEALDSAIVQIAEITSTGLASVQEFIENQPDTVASVAEITETGLSAIQQFVENQPDVATEVARTLDEKLDRRPDWAAGLAEAVRDVNNQIVGLIASHHDRPEWAATIAENVDTKLDGATRNVDEAIGRLSDTLTKIDESLTLNGEVASTTLETIGKVLDGTVDQVKALVDIEPSWVPAVIGAFDAEPVWVQTQRDELAKMTNWLGRQTAASSDQVMATLNEFTRQMQPVLDIDDRLARIEQAVADQLSNQPVTVESQARVEALLGEMSGQVADQSARTEQILAGVDDVVAVTSNLSDLSVETITASVDSRLGSRFDTLDTAVSGFADKFGGYDTRFETLNAMISGVVAVVERTADNESKFLEDQAERSAATSAMIDTIVSTIDAMAAQVDQMTDQWSATAGSLDRFGETSGTIETQVTNLAQFSDTTLSGLLEVLERNEAAMAQVVESVTGPDDLRTHLAELRSAIGGVARDIQRQNGQPGNGGAGSAAVGEAVTAILDQMGAMRDELSVVSETVVGVQSLSELNSALGEVRAVRGLLEGLQERFDRTPGVVSSAVASETDELVDKVNQAAATLTELRLVAAGQSEKVTDVGSLVETVRLLVDDMYSDIGPKIARLSSTADDRPAPARAVVARPKDSPKRTRPLRAS